MQVVMSPLKQRALNLPEPVRSLILSEGDLMDSNELISKLGTWDRLLVMARNGGR
jgi:hypothetical protein